MNEINSNKGKNIIYVINDIRLQHGEENRLQLINHNATIHNLPLQNHRPGGCAILTPKGIHITVHNNHTKESILMSFNVNNNQRITLATQYVHGSGAKIDRALVDDFARISRDHTGIMVGDFNSPLKIFGSHNDSIAGDWLLEATEDNDLTVVKNKINTYIDNKGGSDNVLDMFILNNHAQNHMQKLEILSCIGSDHLPIQITLNISTSNPPVTFKVVNENQFAYLQENNNEYTGEIYKTKAEIDEAIGKFSSFIEKCKADSTTHKTVRTKNGITLSKETNALITEHRQLVRKRKNKSNMTTEEIRRCNWLGREIKRMIEKDYGNHLIKKGNKIIDEQDPKKRWKLLNDTMNRKQKDNSFRALNRPDGAKAESVEENLEIHASRLQKTCSLEDDDRIEKEFTKEVDSWLARHYPNLDDTLSWSPTDSIPLNDARSAMLCTSEITKSLIKAIKNTGAAGPDNIDHFTLKRLSPKSITRLTAIFNSCITIAYFPDAWKISHVVMIPKPGKDQNDSGNYRPISLCSTLGKLLEKLMLRAFNKFLDDKGLRRGRQCGFTRGRSAQESLLKLSEDAKSAFKGDRSLLGVFVDLEKAFDKLWHNGLIFKLLTNGAPLEMVKLIRSFLTNRLFQIKDGGKLSTPRTLEASAPQGGTSSPPLFNYFIHDIPGSDQPNLICHWNDGSGYADDCAEWRSFLSLIHACQEMQKYLDELQRWGSKWRLLPSPAKTEVIIFSKNGRMRNATPNLTLYGRRLHVVKTVKFLGVTFDQELKWKPHIEGTIRKSIPRSIQISTISKCLNGRDPKLLLQLVNALIVSLYDYSAICWLGMGKTLWQQIHTAHMRPLKSLAGLPRRTPESTIFDIFDTVPIKHTIHRRAVARFEAINQDNAHLAKFQTRAIYDHIPKTTRTGNTAHLTPYETCIKHSEIIDVNLNCHHCTFLSSHACVTRDTDPTAPRV